MPRSLRSVTREAQSGSGTERAKSDAFRVGLIAAALPTVASALMGRGWPRRGVTELSRSGSQIRETNCSHSATFMKRPLRSHFRKSPSTHAVGALFAFGLRRPLRQDFAKRWRRSAGSRGTFPAGNKAHLNPRSQLHAPLSRSRDLTPHPVFRLVCSVLARCATLASCHRDQSSAAGAA